jgi:hypothetical protein
MPVALDNLLMQFENLPTWAKVGIPVAAVGGIAVIALHKGSSTPQGGNVYGGDTSSGGAGTGGGGSVSSGGSGVSNEPPPQSPPPPPVGNPFPGSGGGDTPGPWGHNGGPDPYVESPPGTLPVGTNISLGNPPGYGSKDAQGNIVPGIVQPGGSTYKDAYGVFPLGIGANNRAMHSLAYGNMSPQAYAAEYNAGDPTAAANVVRTITADEPWNPNVIGTPAYTAAHPNGPGTAAVPVGFNPATNSYQANYQGPAASTNLGPVNVPAPVATRYPDVNVAPATVTQYTKPATAASKPGPTIPTHVYASV